MSSSSSLQRRRDKEDIPTQPQSHRVYWQQRLSGTNSGKNSANSNNNLITGSAAVKISPSARACDLTNLLRKTLHLGSSSNDGVSSGDGSNGSKDSLVLVGTLRSVPTDYVRFEHEQEPHSSPSKDDEPIDAVNPNSGSSMMEDFHVVKTLDAKDPCLAVLQDMKSHLFERQRAMDHKINKSRELASPTRRNVLSLRPTIAPQTRWYYVPDTTTPNSPSKQPTMSSCLELDGYLTSFDEEESDDENDCNSENGLHAYGDESGRGAVHGDDEDLLRRALAPFEDDGDENNHELEAETRDFRSGEAEKPTIDERRRSRAILTAEKAAREWRRYLQISQSHAAADKTNASNTSNATLAGYLLKRSAKDPHVWKRHYCVLTQDDFWYVPRVIRADEFLPNKDEPSPEQGQHDDDTLGFETRTIEIAQTHGRISLADATLLGPSQSKPRTDGFDLVSKDGKTHNFRACSPTVSAGAATQASIASAKEWKRMLRTRIQDAVDNSLTKHAELLVTEETVARNDRWRNFLIASDDDEVEIPSLRKNGAAVVLYDSSNDNDSDKSSEDASSLLRSRVLHFGLDVAEYKEGCRQIQTLLWADMAGAQSTPSSSSAAMAAIRKLVKELWREASLLLDRAVQLNAAIVGKSNTSSSTNHRRGLETLCHHVEYVITQKRRRPPRASMKESGSSEKLGDTVDEATDVSGDRHHPARDDYPHQRDPPPIDLFDLLWNELRTRG